MTWTEDALQLWLELWTEFGEKTVMYNDVAIPCVCDPITSGFDPTINAMNAVAQTVFDILRETTTVAGVTYIGAVQCGLYASVIEDNPQTKRPILTASSGQQFTGVRFENDDETQPSIRLIASRKQ